jgi:hypothetical protein
MEGNPLTMATITEAPTPPGQPYDSTSPGPVGPWSKSSASGPGWNEAGGDFESSPPWQQT